MSAYSAIRDHKLHSALLMEPARLRDINVMKIHVSVPNRSRIGFRSCGRLKTVAVRKATNTPSRVKSTWAFASALLYQSRVKARRRRSYSRLCEACGDAGSFDSISHSNSVGLEDSD